MNNVNYLDGDREREIREALRFAPLDDVAARAGYSPECLGRLLGLPQVKPAAQQPADYLWASDDSQEVL
jgi:hypothetical protein